MRHRFRTFGPLTALAALIAQPAQATAWGPILPAAMALAVQNFEQPACTPRASVPEVTATSAKSMALLGGAPSRLELMLRQQASVPTPSLAGAPPCPATVAPAVQVAEAQAFATPAPNELPDEFLSSRRLAIAHTAFDAQWARISHPELSPRAAHALLTTGSDGSLVERMAAVNAWTNVHIRYAEDQELYGKADYWASARETLQRRAGDCEDIAILKMQLLAAMGVRREDIFLTIARDLARHADHAFLVVRDGDRFWLLDNSTPALLDARAALDYRPIFSFSQSGKWLHGYTSELAVAPVPPPQPALSAR